MGIKFTANIKRSGEEWNPLPEEVTIPSELNGRHDLPDIEELIHSIVTHGQIQPVLFRREGGNMVLVSGFSRLRAIAEINKRGLKPMPMRLRGVVTLMTEHQAFLATIEENRVRNATTPMDDAHNIQRLLHNYSMTEEEVAATYRASTAWVRDRLQLLELTSEAAEAVHTGRVKPSAAKAIAKLSKELQRKVVAKEGRITAKDVQAEVAPATDEPHSVMSLSDAVKLLLDECASQSGMVYEVHRDTIAAIREAFHG